MSSIGNAPERWLSGREVAFTGRLLSMTRPEAASLIRSCGGRYASKVGPETAVLVIGQAGLPLAESGKLSSRLLVAKRLRESGQKIEIVSEEEFLDRLGIENSGEGVHRLFTAAQVASLLEIPVAQLRHWTRIGLIRAVRTLHTISYYDFSQVSVAKRLLQLTRSGVRASELRKSLRQLSAWMPDMQVPLEQLQVLEDSKRLLVRMEAGHLAEPTGQLNIDFAAQAAGPTTRDVQPNFKIHSADGWFDRACQHEEAEEYEEAAAAYRQALLVGGPTPELCFNLANVLYQLDKKAEASERFRQAVELDPAFAEAWNNLGITLAELKQCEEAVTALQHAVEQNPDCADSYFNLADCLEEIGCPDEAARYWQAYIRLDPQSSWGAYARQRAQGRKSAD